MSLSESPIAARTGVDSVWARLRVEAAAAAAEEPILASFLNAAVLRHDHFSHAPGAQAKVDTHHPRCDKYT